MIDNALDRAPESWHAHVYFDAKSQPRAEALVARVRAAFPPDDTGITYGRWHQKPVGPHPDWSTQLAIPHDQFAAVMAMVTMHQDGLVIFIHPNTGDSMEAQLGDHRDRAVWIGAVRPLKLSVFGVPDQQ